MIKLRTDHKWKQFHYRDEVPARVLASEFDWTNNAHEKHGDYSDGFIKCYREWYHVGQFERLPASDEPALKGWHGLHSFGFSSGLLIKLSDDGEEYQIAYYWVEG